MALHSNLSPSPEAGMCDAETRSLARRKLVRSGEMYVCASPTSPSPDIDFVSRSLRSDQLARLDALLTFCDPLPMQCLRTLTLSKKEWEKLLHWLDLSGLALYFFDRLIELGLGDLLPSAVFNRLRQNLIDNTQRTRGMIAETIAIQQEFQKTGLKYANLKGLSLCPISVPKLELRSQFDLDFLVAESCVPQAQRILEQRGYRLYAISGRSLEFKFNERPGVSLKDIYKDFRSYAVELHVESSALGRPSPLERLDWRELHGLNMPLLSPVDLLLGQGLHLFKHICGESLRTAHLLEFRRHVLYRRDDDEFWRVLQVAGKNDPRASLGLGVVTFLIARVMGDFAPEALTRWTVDSISRPMQLWVEMYGHRVALGNYPGNKLYLLLQKEYESAGIPKKRSLRLALLPSRLPPPVIRAFPNEALSVRILRYSAYLQLILGRLRFHVVEGFRFVLESRRWRRVRELVQ